MNEFNNFDMYEELGLSAEEIKFIFLRAEGITFAKIAEELGGHKQTYMSWARKYSDFIQREKRNFAEELLNKLRLSRSDVIKRMAKFYRKSLNALSDKDPSELSIDKLIQVIEKLHKVVNVDIPETKYKSDFQMLLNYRLGNEYERNKSEFEEAKMRVEANMRGTSHQISMGLNESFDQNDN